MLEIQKQLKIKLGPFSDKPSYFIKVPDEIIFFIQNNGKYPDGTEDKKAFEILKSYYPEFVSQVKAGVREIPVENPDLVIRRKPQPDTQYPVPYLSPTLESLKHKRNLRRMDYALAARVIGAIQLFRLGNDTFPVTPEDRG